jgi:DNA-binding NarL/FixJ family response regulator
MKAKAETRILVVEDQAIIAMTLEETLQRMGYVVIGSVCTADDAIRMVGESRPELILMDIRIQGEKDGIAAAEEINRLYKIPIVYLTAHSDNETLERARKTLPYGYLIKPFRERELHSTIQIALFKHRLIQKEIDAKNEEIPSSEQLMTAHLGDFPERKPHVPEDFEKMILTVLDTPVFVLSADLRPVYFNTALEQLFLKIGYTGTWFDGEVFQTVPGSYLGSTKEYKDVLETRQISRVEKTFTAGDTQKTYVLVRVPLVRENARYVAVILHDITRERAHEIQLRALQANYEQLLARLGVVIKDEKKDTDPVIQKISGIIDEMIITLSKMDHKVQKIHNDMQL